MANMTFSERRQIPIYDDPAQVEWGIVEFDHDKCRNAVCAQKYALRVR